MTELEARKWAIEMFEKLKLSPNDDNLYPIMNMLTDDGRLKFDDDKPKSKNIYGFKRGDELLIHMMSGEHIKCKFYTACNKNVTVTFGCDNDYKLHIPIRFDDISTIEKL